MPPPVNLRAWECVCVVSPSITRSLKEAYRVTGSVRACVSLFLLPFTLSFQGDSRTLSLSLSLATRVCTHAHANDTRGGCSSCCRFHYRKKRRSERSKSERERELEQVSARRSQSRRSLGSRVREGESVRVGKVKGAKGGGEGVHSARSVWRSM